MIEQSGEALQWTRYGELTHDDETGRWWVRLSPSEIAPRGTPETVLEAGVSIEAPLEHVAELLSARGLVAAREWKPQDRYKTDRVGEFGEYGRVAYYTVVWPKSKQALAESRLAAALRYREAGLRRETNVRTATAAVLAGALLMAIAPLPSGYYEFLRWLILVGGAVLAVLTFRASGARWGWIVGIVTIVVLWNPLFPIYLDRSTWLFLDVAASLALGLCALWSRNTPPSSDYFPVPEMDLR